MNKRHVVLLVCFISLCVIVFIGAGYRENRSSASETAIAEAKKVPPFTWANIWDLEDGASKSINGNFVRIEKTSTYTVVNVFTRHAVRDGKNLIVDYWAYTFDQTGEVVLSDLSTHTINGYFSGKTDSPDFAYLPPVDNLNVYTDEEAKQNNVSAIEEGDIGIRFDETTNYALPWGKGVYTKRVKNPRDT